MKNIFFKKGFVLLIAAAFLVGGFFVAAEIARAYTGGGTATIAVDGGGNVSGVTVTKSISHKFVTVLTIDTAGMTLGATSPTFTIPTGFTVPTAHSVATAGDVNADGQWSVVAGTGSCVVDSSPTSSTTTATMQVITVDITASCAVGDTITLTYKGTSNVTMEATQLVVSTTNAGDTTTPTPLTAGSPTITVLDIQATPTFSPVAGSVTFGTAVTISSSGADAIFYTINGNTPTTASTNQATTPLVINAPVTVRALAVKAGTTDSAIGSAAYTQTLCTSVCYVNGGSGNDSNDGITAVTAKKTIQAAIAQVSAGGTINVAAGTYITTGAQVLINKNLSIVGANKTTTIIKPNTDMGVANSDAVDDDAWFLVGVGKTFNVSNVTLDGTGKNVREAIRHHGNGIINNLIIKQIKYVGSYLGTAIDIHSSETINVTNTEFSDIGRVGILFKGAATSDISGNTYIGKGAIDGLDYAIETQYGANVTIDNNTISGNTGTAALPDGSDSAAISIWDDSGTVVLTNNHLNNNHIGVAVAFGGFGTSTSPVVNIGSGNIFNGGDIGVDLEQVNAGNGLVPGSPSVTFGTSTFKGVTKAINIANGISAGQTIDISNVIFKTAGDTLITDNFAIEDLVYHALDATNRGLLVWNSNNLYVTQNSGSIQRGIDAVSSGYTINIAAGTYAENVQIFNKTGLTIKGIGDGTLIAGTGYGIEIDNSSNLTIKDLKIITNGPNLHGIYVDGNWVSGRGVSPSNNLTIQNTTISATGGVGTEATGIYADYVTNGAHTGWLITGNRITADGGGIGLEDVTASTVSNNVSTITNGTNILWLAVKSNLSTLAVSGNTVNGSGGSQVSFLTDYHAGSAGNTITGVIVSGNTFDTWGSRGLRIGTGVSGVTVSQNKFMKIGEALSNENVSTINAESNYWGEAMPNFATKIVTTGGAVDSDPWYLNEGKTILSSTAPAAIWVDDGYSAGSAGGHTFGYDAFTTIQAGVNKVVASGTVNVAAGTYAENVTISTPLILQGVSGANLTGQITIAANGVTVDGMNITNPTLGYGIYAADHNNITITNNTIHDVGTTLASGSVQAIAVVSGGADVSTVDIEHNHISNIGNLTLANSGSGSAKGIYIGNSSGSYSFSGVTIHHNDITNVLADGVDAYPIGRGAYGILVSHNTTGLTISDNIISTLNGLWAHGIGLEGNTPSAVLSGNIISNLISHKTPTDAFAIYFESNASKNTVSLNSVTLGNTSTVVVDDNWIGYDNNPVVSVNGNNYIFGVNAFATIQAAITAVSPSGTINVAAGTYTETGQIVINKNLTIVGANKINTIIKPAQDTTSANKDDPSAWILVNPGITFNLSGVTLDGVGRKITNAILSHGSGTIDGNIIKNIEYEKSGPAYSGTGVALYGSTATVSNNSFSDIGREGVYAGNGSVVTITGNTYTGKGSGNFLDYAFEVGRNGHATINGNTISNNLGVASVDQSISAGILVSSYYNPETPSGATITSNIISNTTNGIDVGNGATATINLNTISNSKNNAIYLHSSSNNSITNNIISGTNYPGFANTLIAVNDGNAAWGIAFDLGSNNNTVTGNDITTSDVAIENWDGSGNVVTNNKIHGNFFGVHNHILNVLNVVDATHNWWGNASGPGVVGPGTGDKVSTNVTFNPWYVDTGMVATNSDISALTTAKGIAAGLIAANATESTTPGQHVVGALLTLTNAQTAADATVASPQLTVDGQVTTLNNAISAYNLALVAPSSMTAYDAALVAVAEIDYTPASWATYQGVVSANVVTNSNSQGQVNIATSNITTAQGSLVTKLAAAKTTSHGVLTIALGTYTQGNYTIGNWTTLTGFKTTGDTNINAATDLAGVSTAESTATTGMAGVKKEQAALTITSTIATYGADLSLTTSGGTTAGTVTYVVDSGTCTVSGSTLTPTGAGTCSITATMAGNTNYNAVSSSSTAITINKAAATLVINGFTGPYDAGAHGAIIGTATGISNADLTGSVVLGSTFTNAPGGTANWTFSNANYADQSGSATITINKVTPTATLTVSNSPATYDANTHVSTVNISAFSVPGTVQNILTGGAATQINAGTYAVTANFVPDDSTNYNTLTGLSAGNFVINPRSSGGGGMITPPAATPAVPAKVETPDGCAPGDKFSTTTGRNCNAATPAVPAGQVLGASTEPISGCGNRTNGFSIVSGQSCFGNSTGQVLGAQAFIFTKLMKQGSKGSDVLELQKFLNAAGYNVGTADGKFGPKSKAALIKFQIANKLKGDGIAGPKVREFLNK